MSELHNQLSFKTWAALQKAVAKEAEKEHAHAELSASGSERWLNCPGSVKLCRDIPEPPPSKRAIEGSEAHKLLEIWLHHLISKVGAFVFPSGTPDETKDAVAVAIKFIKGRHDPRRTELIPEEKISLEFIHKDMFGTADIQIVEDFEDLEVWDYKNGKGKIVEVGWKSTGGTDMVNTQLIYYALGVAHKHGYNFKGVRVGVIQPRAEHVSGEVIRSVYLTMADLKSYADLFKKGVDRVYVKDPRLQVGPWCHWCRAKERNCPKYEQIKIDALSEMFDDDVDDFIDLPDDDFSDLGF